MEISFPSLLSGHSGFLQKVVAYVASNRIAFKVEMDVHVFSEPRRVIVSVGFCVTEGF